VAEGVALGDELGEAPAEGVALEGFEPEGEASAAVDGVALGPGGVPHPASAAATATASRRARRDPPTITGRM